MNGLRRPRGLAALLLVAVFLIGGLGAFLLVPSALASPPPTSLPYGNAPLGPSHVAPTKSPTAAALASPTPAASPPSSGKGTFFVNVSQPYPNATYATKFSGNRVNATNEPSLNLTTNGFLVVAYNAFTNQSPCQSRWQNYTDSEIAISVSSNLGVSWGSPQYLGGWNSTTCSTAQNQLSAWEPSLASLPNGTLVLAYAAYNGSSCYYPACIFYSPPAQGALMFTESFNNGTTWTTPRILNVSTSSSVYPPGRPWITAIGSTVYVAWQNETQPFAVYGSTGSEAVHLLVSKNGGSTWTRASDPKVYPGVNPYSSSPNYYAANPYLLVAKNGTLYYAYTTNWTFRNYNWCQGKNCYPYGVNTADVVVAATTTNGTNWSYSIMAKDVLGYYSVDPQTDPSPQLAINPSTGRLFGIFDQQEIGTFCYVPGSCYLTTYSFQVFVSSSTNGGVTWSTPVTPFPDLLVQNGPDNLLYNPSAAVDSKGILHVEASWVNNGACTIAAGFTFTICGQQQQLYTNSSDNGTTFISPLELDPNATFYPYYWDGQYDKLLTAGTTVLIAWVADGCALKTGQYYYYCFFPPYYSSSPGYATLEVSYLFTGVGVTVSFNETGLLKTANWTANLMGNIRGGSAGTTLSVSGVPTGAQLFWSVPWVNVSYGLAFASSVSPTSPGSFTMSATITATFSEVAYVNIESNPSYQSFYCMYFQINYCVSPIGANWYAVGSSLSASVVPNTCTYTYGCFFTNLSFISWTGIGNGSVSVNTTSITFTVNGPINETANFNVVGFCYTYSGKTTCAVYSYNMTFVEKGLSNGTTWAVTLGQTTETSTTNQILFTNATAGANPFTIWTVPTATTGTYWVGTPSVISPVWFPVQKPLANSVVVNFSQQVASATTFPVAVEAVNLPNATQWSLSAGTASFGFHGLFGNITIPGGTYTVNGSFVYNENGTGYYASGFRIVPDVVNETAANITSTPGSVTIAGPSTLEVVYSPMYRVTAASSTGGTVSLAAAWVNLGSNVSITATVLAGYYFIGWTGSGSGSVTGTSTTILVKPVTPVYEFATFAPIPAPRYNITVGALGLPPGVNFSVVIGTSGFTGTGSFRLGGFLAGNYNVTVPYANFGNQTRFTPVAISSSFAMTGLSINVTGDGFVNVTFATQYLLTVVSDANGKVTPAPGTYWYSAGAKVTLTATPAFHYQFAGWNGSGPNSYTGSLATITVPINGPTSEAAQFTFKLFPPPAVYTLTVTESGLPTGLTWNVSAAGHGASGTATQLTVTGLNGSYTFVVPNVLAAPGTRYVPSNTSGYALQVTQNSTLAVTFSEQFELVIQSLLGGNVTPSVSGWYDKGATVSLLAVANASSKFVAWNGTGTGSYTGALPNGTVTMNGPVTEVATFAPVYHPLTTGSAVDGLPIALGVLVALLGVGVAVGLLLGRRGRRPPIPSPMTEYEAAPAPQETTMEAPTPEGAAPEEYYSEGAPPSSNQWNEEGGAPPPQ